TDRPGGLHGPPIVAAWRRSAAQWARASRGLLGQVETGWCEIVLVLLVGILDDVEALGHLLRVERLAGWQPQIEDHRRNLHRHGNSRRTTFSQSMRRVTTSA